MNLCFKVPVVILLILTASGCATLKETGKTIGHATRDITRDIGHTTRDAAKEISKSVKEEERKSSNKS